MARRPGALQAPQCLAIVLIGACVGLATYVPAGITAGHALLFQDHGVVLWDFKNFPTTELTFEAWISTSDFCHRGTILSYAIDSKASDPHQYVREFNSFVIFDPMNLLVCRDFEYIDLLPDLKKESCAAAFNHTSTARLAERDGTWHHLAVTWTAANNGYTQIFMDGLLMSTTVTGKTTPLPPGGALMLGNDQDCYGGCTDVGQGYNGMLDEVRIWNTVRQQDDIIKWMRRSSGLENHKNLVAYWKFDDASEFDPEGRALPHLSARDSSGQGNDLPLVVIPQPRAAVIEKNGHNLNTGSLTFANNYAANDAMTGMPLRDFTVEFWARTPAIVEGTPPPSSAAEFFSFATRLQSQNEDHGQASFVDDAILIEKYLDEYGTPRYLWPSSLGSTVGSISVHVNANREGNGGSNDNWLDYAVGWTDNEWHHVALTWRYDSGETQLFYDGEAQVPFWRSQAGQLDMRDAKDGGVSSILAPRTSRAAEGSLVLGQNQECYGGCFSPAYQLHGDMAVLRIWDRALRQDEVKEGMWTVTPTSTDGLLALYDFAPGNVVNSKSGQPTVHNLGKTPDTNRLYLWSDTPRWVRSTAPLTDERGLAVPQPPPGPAGHALYLHDKQVLILPTFKDFPSSELTIEFWMWSSDGCRSGVPFSYALGEYNNNDNAFLIFDYNNWGISVMEDEGKIADHRAGFAATDGKWHHIAVTWKSSDGATQLYDNGRLAWQVVRGKGVTVPSGGTLVVGREQDCVGGCFDSAAGATGKVDKVQNLEYGQQDFYGLIDEMRVWRKARSEAEIKEGMSSDLARLDDGVHNSCVGGTCPERAPPIATDHTDLLAYWKFDEGQGYVVHDVTGHGNDLSIQMEPRWVSVETFGMCGNGVVEGGEECDDGSRKGGDGCDAHCKVEPDWECTGSSLSLCRRIGSSGDPAASHTDGSSGSYFPDVPGAGWHSKGSSRGHGWLFTTLGVVLAAILIAMLVAGVYKREVIFEAFPQVERGAESIRERLTGRSVQYDGLALDPEDSLHLAPDFVGTTPGPRAGPYSSLPGFYNSAQPDNR